MFVEEGRSVGPSLDVRGAISVEIDWALSGAHRASSKTVRPVLEDLYERDPALRESVTTLWRPDEALSYPGYLELSILAHHGGVLFDLDGDALIAALGDLAVHGPRESALAAEIPEDRRRLLRRLEVLRTSSRRRKHYIDVVGRVWSELKPAWERDGRPAVLGEISARRRMLESNPSWQEFTAACDGTCRDRLPQLVEALDGDGELALVPAWFSQKGLFVDLPGLILVGIGVEGAEAGSRAHAEALAGRLKAIADPTRLAILASLARKEMTVSELARRFSLAQPTVSNHIKMLREAGFVAVKTAGRSRLLVVQPEVLDGLERDLQGILATTPPQ